MEASVPSASGRSHRPAFALLPALILLAATAARGATHRSTNFAVEAPSAEAARKVAEAAEGFRKASAVAWLGRELPPWPAPCPVRVRLTDGEAGGLTTFTFDKGRVSDQRMAVEGRLDRVLTAALPH